MSEKLRILYALRGGRGGGHIERARILIPLLKERGADIQVLVSGDESSFDMDVLGNYRTIEGLTIVFRNSSVKKLGTLGHQVRKLPKLVNEIRRIDLTDIDLVISDCEPVTANAAYLNDVPCVGLGHHYSFQYDVPKGSPYELFMMYFKWGLSSFLTNDLALHYHHFDYPILPPLIDTAQLDDIAAISSVTPGKILVYLNFETVDDVVKMLEPYKDSGYEFHFYSPLFEEHTTIGNIHCKPRCREGFKKDMAECEGVITNGGFMTSSEVLYLGKKLLVKPANGRSEQIANAISLEKLGWAMAMDRLDSNVVGEWLQHGPRKKMPYPNVAERIADWITEPGQTWQSKSQLVNDIWQEIEQSSTHNATHTP